MKDMEAISMHKDWHEIENETAWYVQDLQETKCSWSIGHPNILQLFTDSARMKRHA